MFKDIETERCRLRLFQVPDLVAFAEYRADPQIAQFQSWSSYSYVDALALYLDISSKAFGLLGEWYQLALADKASDQLLGDVAVHFASKDVTQIALTITPKYQGKGYDSEGLVALLGYLFDDLRLKRVFAITDAGNLPSISGLESVGFERVSVTPKEVIFKGKPSEEHEYCYTIERWQARHRSLVHSEE